MSRASVLRLVAFCAVVVIAHAILLAVVVRTGAVETLMSGTFSPVQLAIVIVFVGCRLATYLVVPALLIGTAVELAAWRLITRSSGL